MVHELRPVRGDAPLLLVVRREQPQEERVAREPVDVVRGRQDLARRSLALRGSERLDEKVADPRRAQRLDDAARERERLAEVQGATCEQQLVRGPLAEPCQRVEAIRVVEARHLVHRVEQHDEPTLLEIRVEVVGDLDRVPAELGQRVAQEVGRGVLRVVDRTREGSQSNVDRDGRTPLAALGLDELERRVAQGDALAGARIAEDDDRLLRAQQRAQKVRGRLVPVL